MKKFFKRLKRKEKRRDDFPPERMAIPHSRQVRVFISSTFRDMQKERDYLMSHIFPKPRKRCREDDAFLLKGHTNKVNGTIELKHGRILSWTHDGTLRTWDGGSGNGMLVVPHKIG